MKKLQKIMKRKRNSSKVSITKNILTWKKIDGIVKSFEILIFEKFDCFVKKHLGNDSFLPNFFFFLRLNLSMVGLFIDF